VHQIPTTWTGITSYVVPKEKVHRRPLVTLRVDRTHNGRAGRGPSRL
jgi:hypothetical protein